MKSLCTKSFLFAAMLLLVVAAAACTQSKPEVPTPTLVPLANETIVLNPEAQPTAGIVQATPAPGEPTLIPQQPVGEATLVPVDGTNPTPIIVEPTLLPIPTVGGGDTGQQPQTTPVPGETPQTQPSGACTNPYIVQPGEWFYAIARKCGVTPQALLAANPGMDPNVLRPGQSINLPAGGAAPSEPQPTVAAGDQPPPASGQCSNPYVIQSGDTLSSIARACGTTVDALMAANSLPSADYIFPGQQLQIP